MSAGRDLKILIRTIADMTGLSRLGRGVSEHSRSVRALGGIYRAAARAGAAGFRLVGSAIGAVNAGLRRLRNYAMVASAALTAIAVKGTKEWMDKEDSIHNLAGAIEALGYDVDALLPKFNALADEMQDTTRMSDDQTRALVEVLLNLGVMPDKIDEAVRGSIGLAKVMRTDAATAARYFAVSLEGDYTMLRRYIPALRSATSESEQAAIVQRVMAAGFNQATAAAGNAAGRFQQLRNRIGDLWARLGQSVTEALNLTDAFHRAERAVKALIESAVWDKITDGLRTAFDTVMANVRTVRELITEIRSGNIGAENLMEIGKTIVLELVKIAVVALGEGLAALQGVAVGLAKVMAAAFGENILHLPGVSTAVGMSAAHTLRGIRKRGEEIDPERERYLKGMASMRREDQAAAMRSGSSVVMQQGVEQALSAIPGAMEKVSEQIGRSQGAVADTVREQTGFDYGSRKSGHLEDIGIERVAAQERVKREEEKRRSERAAAQAAAEASKIAQQKAEIAAFQRRQAIAPIEQERQRRRSTLEGLQGEYSQRMSAPVGRGGRGGIDRRKLEMAIAKESEGLQQIESAIAHLERNHSTVERILHYMEATEEKNRKVADKLAIIESKMTRLPI